MRNCNPAGGAGRSRYSSNTRQVHWYRILSTIKQLHLEPTELTQQPLISVVIVNYNVRDFLHNCLQSLRRSLHGMASEIIVVDNHSTDSSVEFLTPLFPEVQFLALKENIGFGKANNVGFAMAKGRYVLCLNPDTLLSEDTMQVMVEYMEQHPDVGLSGCKLLNGDGTFQLACRRGFPTPWVAFTRSFGLQSLFPKSQLFGRYNQTFRDVNATYEVDAVSGAFMFIRREALEQVRGFDPDFFMYGEDLDICYRVTLHGWKVAYVHTTSVIHFKGESTKRSSINEVGVFYDAMAIFVQKHFASSRLFLLFLRTGIAVRTVVAYISFYRLQILLFLLDMACVNGALLISTKLRMDEFFGFPSTAYPTVHIVISVVIALSMLFTGEYLSRNGFSFRRAFSALMISFFVLSSMTYFFRDYAFSRGVLLMTIGFSLVLSALVRVGLLVFDKIYGAQADRRLAVIGINAATEQLLQEFERADARNTAIVGIIATEEGAAERFGNKPVLGNIEYLEKILRRYGIREVIITDNAVPRMEMMRRIANVAGSSAHFHFADMYDQIVAARIIEKLTGVSPAFPQYNITLPRYRIIKRTIDIVGALFLLTIGLPVVYLASVNPHGVLWKTKQVLRGRYSLFGVYPTADSGPTLGKIGLTGLAHISEPDQLSQQAIRNLNEYYVRHYTLSLDLEIFLKFFFRKTSGVR